MISRFLRILSLLLCAMWWAGPATAQAQPDAPKPAFQLAPPPADRAITANRPTEQSTPPGVVQKAWSWLLYQQQRINRQLADAVKDLKATGSFAAAGVLAFLSFSYGVLHAAGPGHGKAIISSYVLANERTVRRGIMLSFLAAFIQALSAITLVGVMAIALNATSLQMKSTENTIETLSWAFVAMVGAWLLYGQVRKLFAGRAATPLAHAHSHDHAPPHTHAHDQGAACGCGHDHAHEPAPTASHAQAVSHHHGHGHTHDQGECCDHAHMPDPKELEGPLSWGNALAIAFSVGIRPCTGAILVMIFALSQGMLWAGIFSTFAMALGTAITVSALAAMAVGSREFAARWDGGDGRWATRVATAAGLAGSALVFLMGTAFFIGSLQGGSPL